MKQMTALENAFRAKDAKSLADSAVTASLDAEIVKHKAIHKKDSIVIVEQASIITLLKANEQSYKTINQDLTKQVQKAQSRSTTNTVLMAILAVGFGYLILH